MLTNLQYTNANLYDVGVSKGFDLGPVRLDVRLLGREFDQRGEQASRIRGVDAFDILVGRNGRIIGHDFHAIPLKSAEGNVSTVRKVEGSLQDHVDTKAKGTTT
jgi:hypothetical protein